MLKIDDDVLKSKYRMEINRPAPGDGLDVDAALARVGGDVDLLKDIARVFLDDCPRALAELQNAGARGDCAAVERAAHGLKGAASNFGASVVVAAGLRIEQMGHAGTLEEFGPALASFEAALASLSDELEALLAS
jgi:HPt (histidine-containing phosphotransfer) domain-containing protein